jgi:hypothetical protein
MREPRTAVMTMVEASWQDESGTQRTVPACMEVKSAGGACIRLRTPIGVGSKLSIRWRFDTFTGTARNCRSEGREYLVGIQRDAQRDAADPPVVSPPVPPVAPPAERAISTEPQPLPEAAAAAWTARMRSLRTLQEIKQQEIASKKSAPQEDPSPQAQPRQALPPQSQQAELQGADVPIAQVPVGPNLAEVSSAQSAPGISPVEIPVVGPPSESVPPPVTPAPRAEAVPFVRIAEPAAALLPRRPEDDMRIRHGPGPAQFSTPQPAQSAKPQGKPTPQRQGEDGPGKERKHMRPKWLGLAPWHHKPDAPNESRNGNRTIPGAAAPGNSNAEGEKENFMPHATPPASGSVNIRMTAANGIDDSVPFQVDLLPMEDIYRSAGIMGPPKGYGIKKVVDMLNSEYVRSLSKEMKRAAVLMALDAAGVPIDQLQQDASARQDALNSYEAAQREQVEAEWARKAEENVHIQAELERMKAHHQARIARNLDAIEREKATFSSWLAIKQHEARGMLEAAELCLNAPAPESTVKTEAAKPDPIVTETKAAKSQAHASPASDSTQNLLAEATLAKAAAAGSKPM